MAALISPHLPHTIFPEVLETFMVMENMDSKDTDSIARYLISCCEVEDTSEVDLQLERLRLNLNSSSAPEAIAAYTTAFLKILRLAPYLTDAKSKLHFFINGIRPDAVKRILKHDMRNKDIEDLPELVLRLKKLLPRYHLPYSEFYSFHKRFSAPGLRNIDQQSNHSRPSSRFSSRRSSNQFHSKQKRNPSFRTPHNPRTPSTSSRTPIKSASKSSQDIICRFWKQPGHMIKDCPEPNCRPRYRNSSLVPPGKAPGSSNKSLSLEANPDLDSDLEPVYADCARHDGGVTELGNSVTERSNLNHHDNKVPSTTTNPCLPADPSHASVIILNPKITILLKELNKPMDRKLLHLRWKTSDHLWNDRYWSTISCISRDLVQVARLKPTGSSLKLNLADNNSVECQVVSGTLAFALGGTAKLTYVSTTLAVLECPNSCLIGCDFLKSLGLLTNNYLFINLTERNLSIQDENAVPDQFMPPALTLSTAITLPDLDKAKFLLNDSSLTQNIKDLLLKYPQIFSKRPDSRGIDCPPMTIEFYDESEIVSKKARYLPPDKLRIANEQIDLLIEHGFAVPYNGPFSSPIYGINAKTVPIPADLPRISDVCRFLSNATYIASLDLPKDFWQLNLHPDDQPKTAISIPGRKVMFTRASFGLKNVPAIFQNLMKRIFNLDGIFIYMDDLILAANSKPEFLARLDKLCVLAQKYRVRIGLHKCAF
ncbi:hypothetical protein P9112_013961 [Eukaryota sp. TZLM1-RC]